MAGNPLVKKVGYALPVWRKGKMPDLAIIVTGDRHAKFFKWESSIKQCLAHLNHTRYRHRTVIHGDCSGIDKIFSEIARNTGWNTLPIPFISDEGNSGGPHRNQIMVEILLKMKEAGIQTFGVAFHDHFENSRGTKDCHERLTAAGYKVPVYKSDSSITT